MGIQTIRHNDGPKFIGRFMGFGTQRIATALKGTLNTISKAGRYLGVAGYILSAVNLASKALTGKKISIYKMFKLIPRKDPIDHSLAASFFSLMFATNLLTIIVSFRFFYAFQHQFLFFVLFFALFVVTYCAFRMYFVIKQRYKNIILKYDARLRHFNFRESLFGIFYAIFSILSFYLMATLPA